MSVQMIITTVLLYYLFCCPIGATGRKANTMSFSEKSAAITLNFEVRRNRASVTQGTATVLLNGQELITFGVKIEIIHPGEKYYGPMIGGWASKTPDYNFIRGLLWHNLDEIYHHSDKPKAIMQRLCEESNPGTVC